MHTLFSSHHDNGK